MVIEYKSLGVHLRKEGAPIHPDDTDLDWSMARLKYEDQLKAYNAYYGISTDDQVK